MNSERRLSLALALACLVMAACSPTEREADEANGNIASSAPEMPASSANPPLEIPDRVASGAVTENGGGWNEAVQRITYLSSADNTRQPMMFYRPPTDEPRPLVVGLHSWSADYTQQESAIYAEWAIANGWVFIHPDFRGPNVRPQATGSELVIQDVLSAIEYAKTNASVDESRIYAVGWSGGGHLGLLLAGLHPEIWAGVSAWVPVTDLQAWYQESLELGTTYAGEIEASCGGPPTGDTAAAAECRKRSPVTYLERAKGVPIDISHGIRDGQSQGDPVPIGQSLRAFNLLAAPSARLTGEEIDYFAREQQVPPNLRGEAPRSSPGRLRALFQRQSGNARITVVDGAHDKDTEAAFRWLNEQRKQ